MDCGNDLKKTWNTVKNIRVVTDFQNLNEMSLPAKLVLVPVHITGS